MSCMERKSEWEINPLMKIVPFFQLFLFNDKKKFIIKSVFKSISHTVGLSLSTKYLKNITVTSKNAFVKNIFFMP